MSGVPSLYGRDDELRGLSQVIEATVRGAGSVTVVEGEAGIGKSALVDAALARARELDIPVLRAGAEEMDAHRPFGVMAGALGVGGGEGPQRQRIAALLRSDPTLEEQSPGGWAALEFRIGEALIALLDQTARSGPAVLVAEDLHWADPASLVVLSRLCRSISATAVAVVMTLRPLPRRRELSALLDDAVPPTALRYRLGALDAAAWEALAEDLVGAHLGPQLRDYVAGAGGNPLFVREVVSGLLAEEAVTRDPPGEAELAHAGTSPSLPVALYAHLSFLAPACVELLGVASVLGSSFSLAVLARMTGRSVAAVWTDLAPARHAGLLVDVGERFAFRHELIHASLYQDLPGPVRTGLHADAARALEESGAAPGPVAEHLLRSTSTATPEVLAGIRRAASAATGTAPAVAAELLEAALAMVGPADPLRRELTAELTLAYVASGRSAEGETLARRALQGDGSAGYEAAVRDALIQALWAQGRLAEGYAEAEAAASASGLSDRDRARFAARASMAQVFVGNWQGTLDAGREAEDLARATGDVPARVMAIMTQAHVTSFQGRWGEAADHIDRAVALVEANPSRPAFECMAHQAMSLVFADADRVDEAVAAMQSARQAAEELGMADGVVTSQLAGAYTLFWAGRWDDALAASEVGIALAEETGVAWQTDSLCLIALITLWRGDADGAATLLAEAETRVERGEAQFRLGWPAWVHAALAEAAGDPAAGLAALLPAWELCVAVGMATEFRVFGPLLSRLAAATGRSDLAAEVADALEAQAGANPGLVSVAAAARRVRGLAAADPDLLVEALHLHRASPRAHDRARCAEEAAIALAAAGRPGEARVAAEEAIGVFTELGAEGEVDRTKAELRRRGLRFGARGRRGRPTSGWAALTDTEARVARLVAERLSNPEVAQAMFISRRTVACHVSHLLAKLHMSSRAELVAAAARGPLEDL